MQILEAQPMVTDLPLTAVFDPQRTQKLNRSVILRCRSHPAFATLGRLRGDKARSLITSLTLIGGFASTVEWYC
jgi:hypothetical protein